MKKIWLAGGCFWGVEAYFKRVHGILTTQVGYGQGNTLNPTYEDVCTGRTNHVEVVEVSYDEQEIALDKILDLFFRIIDPTSLNRQGNDIGTQYRTGIYYIDEEDETLIKAFIEKMQQEVAGKIVVEVAVIKGFYPAETYHQDYLAKNPHGYCHINLNVLQDEEKKNEYK